MTIKTSTATEKNQKMQRVQQDIHNLLQQRILNEVPEIKKSIEQLLVSVKNVKFKDDNVKNIEGQVYNAEQILDMIKQSSGNTKWKFSQSDKLSEQEIQDIKEEFNIDFEKTEIERHMFSRSTNDRNTLCFIGVTALPGLFQVELQTDRVGYGLDGLVNVKQFEEGIAAESN